MVDPKTTEDAGTEAIDHVTGLFRTVSFLVLMIALLAPCLALIQTDSSGAWMSLAVLAAAFFGIIYNYHLYLASGVSASNMRMLANLISNRRGTSSDSKEVRKLARSISRGERMKAYGKILVLFGAMWGVTWCAMAYIHYHYLSNGAQFSVPFTQFNLNPYVYFFAYGVVWIGAAVWAQLKKPKSGDVAHIVGILAGLKDTPEP